MAQYAIVTDLNRCTGCLACAVACKAANGVPVGSYWNKVLRIGPNPKWEGAVNPDVELYFLSVGCQFCAMACPYNVRYLNEEEGVVEKCTLCEQKVAQGELPQCVAQCGGRARWFGDLEQGIESFEAPADWLHLDGKTYEDVASGRVKLGEYANGFSDADVHRLPDVGNEPAFRYILRGKSWKGGE